MHSKPKVNRYFIHHVLSGIGGGADVPGEYEKYLDLNVNDVETMKARIIRPLLLPYIRSLDDRSLAHIKLALAYGLSDPGTRFYRIYESVLPPLDPPTNERDFFVWIWEEVFPGESYQIDISQYELKDDLEELNRILRRRTHG